MYYNYYYYHYSCYIYYLSCTILTIIYRTHNPTAANYVDNIFYPYQNNTTNINTTTINNNNNNTVNTPIATTTAMNNNNNNRITNNTATTTTTTNNNISSADNNNNNNDDTQLDVDAFQCFTKVGMAQQGYSLYGRKTSQFSESANKQVTGKRIDARYQPPLQGIILIIIIIC